MKKFFGIIFVLLLGGLLVSCGSKKDTEETITLYTRDTSSGTRDAFFSAITFSEAIKDDSKLKTGVLIVDGNGDMINKVKSDLNAIGYISLTSLNSSGLKGLKFNGKEATEANVLSGDYTLKRAFNYIVTTNEETDADLLAAAFSAYIKTKDAQAIIISKGGIVKEDDKLPSWESIKSNYPVTLKDNKEVTVRFGGSTSVLSIATELSKDFSAKAGNFVAEHNHTGSGDAFTATQGDKKDGNQRLHVGFASRDFKENEKGKENTFGTLALDAVVAVVNKENKINDISKELLKKIYQGTITKWSEVK